jgi:hypothetical protein
MKVGKKMLCFFDRKHFKKLNTKLNYINYRNFIRDVHLRVCEEIILEKSEGFILPNKLGDISIRKEHKKEGIITTHSYLTGKGKEYNRHTFGIIYSVFWDKKIRSRIFRSNYNSLVPSYKGKPIYWFNVFKFTPIREQLKRRLAKKINNQDFNL